MSYKFLKRLVIVLSIVMIIFLILGIKTMRPYNQAKKQAVELAHKHVDFSEISDFYWFNREETIFTLVGETDKGRKVVVFIPEKGNKIKVVDQDKGITEDQALQLIESEYQPNEIIKINLGLIKEVPVWEVVTKNADKSMNYYVINFETGKVTSALKNV